jgi:hypothetical protein
LSKRAGHTEACNYAGISRDTYYRWIAEMPELSDRFELLRQKPILRARETIAANLSKDVNLAWKYLERKLPEEFGVNPQQKRNFKSGYTHHVPIEFKFTHLTADS